MARRAALIAKKKPTKIFSRRSRTGFAAAPTNDFFAFYDYIRTEVDKKEIAQKIKSHLKKTLSKAEVNDALAAPEWFYGLSAATAATIAWKELGKIFPSRWDNEKVVKNCLEELIQRGKTKTEVVEDDDAPKVIVIQRKPPAEIIKERTSDFIGEVEAVLDDFHNGIYLDIENYSVYNELKKLDAAYNTAKTVMDYYTPLMEELEELLAKKTPELVEAYDHLTLKKKKEYLALVKRIIDDAEKYMASKKAVRKTRVPKPVSTVKQVSKVQYMKESTEFKVTSIDPSSIVGSTRVYLFNVKQRIITELVCRLPKGFEIKGTTIQGLDEEQSRSIRLRKPEEFLPLVLSKTPTQINKDWANLTTKPIDPTGRINKDTIILRALNK